MMTLFKGQKPGERSRRGKYGIGIFVVGVIFFLAPLVLDSPLYLGNTFLVHVGSFMMVFAIAAMGLDLLAGYLGLGSLGHAGFVGAAAYCYGILTSRFDWSIAPAFLVTMAFILVLSLLFALLTTRLAGITFLMVNLALGLVIFGVIWRWSSLTGGDNGLGGIPRPEIFGFLFNTPQRIYYFIFVFFAAVAFLLYRLTQSPFGLTLHGIRNSPKRMRALGYNVYRHRFIAYVLSGMVAGLAGFLLASLNNFIGPMLADVSESAKIFLMVLVGGSGTMLGPIIGAAMVVALENIIASYTDRWVTILGAMYVLCVMFTPQGAVGVVEQVQHKIRTIRFKRQTSKKEGQ